MPGGGANAPEPERPRADARFAEGKNIRRPIGLWAAAAWRLRCGEDELSIDYFELDGVV